MFRSAPNLFPSDIENNLDAFIANYVSKFKLPRLSRSDLKPVGESEEDGCLSSGASGSVHRYYLEIPIALEERGYHENNHEVVEEKYLNPVVIPISVEVVVKKIFFQGLSPELSISHFLNEVEILDHFICRVTPDSKKLIDPYYAVDSSLIACYGYCYDCIQDDGNEESYKTNHFWIVLEYAQKGFLSLEIIKSLTNFDRIYVSLRICEGLYALHSNNIIYVDLKPSNILVDNHGLVKLTDFGCSIIACEKFSLFSEEDYNYLIKTSCFDQYMPAIVKKTEGFFKFVFKATSLVSKRDDSRDVSFLEKKQSFLTEIDCPENFRDIVNHFFVGAPRSCVISLGSPVMHFLEEKGYSHSYLERVLSDENGTALWMAPEFYESVYRDTPSHVYIRPSFETDVYSLGITLAELWTGEEPYHEQDDAGSIFPLLRKIASEGLRPRTLRTYSDNGLVEVDTLKLGGKLLKLQEVIRACWDADPAKRPKVPVPIDFFSEWIYDILVESITRNKVYQLKEILEKLQDPRWLLMQKDFKDNPARKAHKISLLQYALWALGPEPILEILFAYVPKNAVQLQSDALLKSDWVKENDIDAECIVRKLMKAYEFFEKLEADVSGVKSIKEQWRKIGGQQRRLPTYLFLNYRKLQEANRENGNGPIHLEDSEDDAIEHWYRKPCNLMSKTVITFSYPACHYDQNKKVLCRKDMLSSDENITLEGFDLRYETDIFKKLLEEKSATKQCIKSFLSL